MKKIVIYMLIITLFMNVNISVHAQSTHNEFYETTVGNDVVFTSSDPSLPSAGNFYFGITSDNHVWYVSMNKAIPMIMNKVIGVTVKPEVLVDFISDYLEFGLINSPFKPVYNGNTKIGIAFENLTGKTLLGSNDNNSSDMTIPSTESNNIYNYYNEWYVDQGYDEPDWVNIETRPKDFYLNKLNNTSNKTPALRNFLNSDTYLIATMTYSSYTLAYDIGDNYVQNNGHDLMYFATTGSWTNIESYNVTTTNNTIRFTDQLLNSARLGITARQVDNLSSTQYGNQATMNTDGTWNVYGHTIAFVGNSNLLCTEDPYVTVYKDTTIGNQFINQTYAPVSYNSDQYYNYSTDNDNSTVTNITETDNSSTTNETIYNESTESFTEYYTDNNYNIDNSVTINNTTTIIENHYGNENGGDDGGDDNGGGSGGDDNDDSGILDKLLDALIDLFKMLGKVIAAILTGIVDLITEVLAALADIITAINPFTELLRLLFGFLPDLVVNTISAGLAICVMIAVLKFLRG